MFDDSKAKAEPKRGVPEKKIQEQIERIKNLRTVGATDSQIMRELGLTRSALSRRVARLNQMNNKIMAVVFRESLVSEVSYLHDRMLRTIQNCETIARNDNYEAADRINAERLKIDVSVALVKLLHEGPAVLGVQETDGIISRQQELVNKFPSEIIGGDTESDLHVPSEGEGIIEEGAGDPSQGGDYSSPSEK